MLSFFASIASGQNTELEHEVVGLEFKTMVFAAQSQRSARADEDDGPLVPEIPELYYFDGKDYTLVDFTVNQLSKVYPFGDATALDFFTQNVGADGTLSYRKVFSVEVDSSWSSAMVLMLPNQESERPVQLLSVDTSPENLSAGTIKVFNLSTEPVVLNADGKVYPLYSTGSVDIDISQIEKNRLPVALALKEDDGFMLVYRRIWTMRSSVRGIYFIYTLNGDIRHWYMRNIIL